MAVPEVDLFEFGEGDMGDGFGNGRIVGMV